MKDKIISVLIKVFFTIAIIFLLMNIFNIGEDKMMSKKQIENEVNLFLKDNQIEADIKGIIKEQIEDGYYYEVTLKDKNNMSFEYFLYEGKMGDVSTQYEFSNYKQRFLEKEMTTQLTDLLRKGDKILFGQYDGMLLDNMYYGDEKEFEKMSENLLVDMNKLEEMEFIIYNTEKDFFLKEEVLKHYYDFYVKMQETYNQTKILLSFTTEGNGNNNQRVQSYNENYFNNESFGPLTYDEFKENVEKNSKNNKVFEKE